jgi:plastocyanin
LSFKPQIGLVAFAILLVLLAPAVHAAPNLSLQNHASYTLSGSLTATQNCTADPVQYLPQACFGYTPPIIHQMNASATIWDKGTCTNYGSNCGFAPPAVIVGMGSFVDWSNNGSSTHTVTADAIPPTPPTFDSRNIAPNQRYHFLFTQPGTFSYHCSIHPWMKGVVTVLAPPTPQPLPMPTKITINLDGTVGWTVQGLDSNNALLQIDHSITVSVSPVPGITVSPVSEHGSFSQNIDLATRVDAPGTASALLRGLFSRFLSGLPYSYPPRTVATLPPGGSVNDPFAGLQNSSVVVQPVSGFLPQQLLSQLPGFAADSKVSYTIWWVNGPLSMGKTVKILTGTSAVTGDETLNLGDDIGNRNGWLVTSMLSQSLDTSVPLSSSSTVSFSFNLAWSFDKKNDLLLRHATTASIDSKSVTSQNILVSNPCAPQGWCPTFAQAIVTRQNHIDVNLSLKLQSTDVKLNGNSGASSSDSSLATAFLQLPWTVMGPAIVGAAGGLTALGVWTVRRVHRHPEPAPQNFQNS